MKTQCVSLFIAQTIVFKSKRIRLDFDCTVASTWCEIDAVKIDGNSGICPECMLHPLSLIVIQIENMMLAIINFQLILSTFSGDIIRYQLLTNKLITFRIFFAFRLAIK